MMKTRRGEQEELYVTLVSYRSRRLTEERSLYAVDVCELSCLAEGLGASR